MESSTNVTAVAQPAAAESEWSVFAVATSITGPDYVTASGPAGDDAADPRL